MLITSNLAPMFASHVSFSVHEQQPMTLLSTFLLRLASSKSSLCLSHKHNPKTALGRERNGVRNMRVIMILVLNEWCYETGMFRRRSSFVQMKSAARAGCSLTLSRPSDVVLQANSKLFSATLCSCKNCANAFQSCLTDCFFAITNKNSRFMSLFCTLLPWILLPT